MLARRRLLALSLVSLIVGCNNPDNSANNALESAPTKAILVLKTMDNPFFVSIQTGFVEGLGGRLRATVRSGTNESDVQGQRTQLRSLLTSHSTGQLAGLVITPSSSGPELVPELKRYRDAGIPVILVDTLIPSQIFRDAGTNYNVALQSDNDAGGALAADALAARLPAGRQSYTVLLLEGAVASDTAQQRRVGFERRITEWAASRHVSLTIVRRVANWRREEARRVTSSIIGRTTPIDGVFAANDEMALGAARAYSGVNLARPPIVGFDAIPDALQAIRDREMAATIAQDPVRMGRRAAELLRSPNLARTLFSVERIPVQTCSPECR